MFFEDSKYLNVPFMKILTTITAIFLLATTRLLAADIDTLAIKSDLLKAPIYAQMANGYLKYDTISDEVKRASYQDKALKYTYLALHYYSRNNDTLGLRNCFDNLATIYTAQKKYSQAKWFVLQSNFLSRAKKDVPNIISSLIALAYVKIDIKDYSLATSDLNEALQLSVANHMPVQESAVQQAYVILYNNVQNYPKAAIALKRHNDLEDSIRRSDEAKLVAKLRAANALDRKKKFYTENNNRVYNNLYFKRIVSL